MTEVFSNCVIVNKHYGCIDMEKLAWRLNVISSGGTLRKTLGWGCGAVDYKMNQQGNCITGNTSKTRESDMASSHSILWGGGDWTIVDLKKDLAKVEIEKLQKRIDTIKKEYDL